MTDGCQKTLLIGTVSSEHVKYRQEAGQSTSNTPSNVLEDIASSIPPPSKSLRPSDTSVGRKIEIKNCQSWLREYVVALVEREVLERSALAAVDDAPTVSCLDIAK